MHLKSLSELQRIIKGLQPFINTIVQHKSSVKDIGKIILISLKWLNITYFYHPD
jgi:hypothetical protein